MPNITLPGIGTENWGELYNAAIEALNTYIGTLENHNHNGVYAVEGHAHSAYETALAGKSNEGHTHSIADITDMPDININLAGVLSVIQSWSGSDKMRYAVKVVAGIDGVTRPPFLGWTFNVKWCHPSNASAIETETIESLSNQKSILKPPADSAVWNDQGKCIMRVTVRGMNPFNGSVSTTSTELSAEVNAFHAITASEMIAELVSNGEALTQMAAGFASNAVIMNALKTAANQ